VRNRRIVQFDLEPVRRAVSAAIALILGITAAAGASETPLHPALLDSIEAAQKSTRDLASRFTQTKFVPAFEETLTSRGQLFFQTPNALLIRYDAPDTSLLAVADSTVTLYYPDLEQAHRFRVREESTVSALLLGFGGSFDEAAKHFRFSEAKGKGSTRLLIAKPLPGTAAADDIDQITLVIDTRRWLPTQTRFRETNGDETLFIFEKLARNSGLPDSIFRVNLPEGTEIIEMKP